MAKKTRRCYVLDNTTHRFGEIDASILKFPTVFCLTRRNDFLISLRCFWISSVANFYFLHSGIFYHAEYQQNRHRHENRLFTDVEHCGAKNGKIKGRKGKTFLHLSPFGL